MFVFKGKGSNVQRLTKALSVHSSTTDVPEEGSSISSNNSNSSNENKYEEIVAPKAATSPTTVSSIPTLINKPKSPTPSPNETTPTTKTTPTEKDKDKRASTPLKELEVAKSKPFVPAKVLMSQHGGANSNGSTTSRKEGRPVSSTVQKLIQTHNQAVAAAAAAAAAAATITSASTTTPTPPFKQNLIINNQPATTTTTTQVSTK